jgi:hypothetical protein
VAQRASTDRRELGIRLVGIAVAIALISAGIMAIGPRHAERATTISREGAARTARVAPVGRA